MPAVIPMNVLPTAFPDVLILEPRVFADDRGFFFEAYNKRHMAEAGITSEFVQDNCSRSKRGVLRGLHYQVRHAQGKLVRVVSGEILDIVVDLRRSSPRFGKWVSVLLSADHNRVLWIPVGYAHGFAVRSEVADVHYKVTDFHSPEDERTIAWNDPELGIDWQLEGAPIVSAKDAAGTAFSKAEIFD